MSIVLVFSNRHMWRRALLFGAALMITTPLMAQQIQEKRGEGLEEEQAQDHDTLAPVVVYSTREEKRVLDVPQSISVISREELDDHQVRDIQDLVRHQPGVFVTRQTSATNPWGQLTGFTIRGMSDNRVQLSVDGSRVQERITDGSRDFFDMGNFQAVEIVRGPNSVLWGADALGGAVMFRTRDPADLLRYDPSKPWALEIKTGYDNFDESWKKQITAAYDFGELQVLGSYNQVSNHEPRLRKARADGGAWGCSRVGLGCHQLFPSDTDVDNILLKAVWQPTIDHRVKLTGELFGRDTRVFQMDYTGGSTANPPTNSRYLNQPYVRDLEMTRRRIALEHQWAVGAVWLDEVKWRLSYSPQKRETDSRQRRVYANRTEQRDQLRSYREEFLEVDVQFQSSFDLGSSHHILTYGFDGDRTQGDYDGINTTFNSLTGVTTTTKNAGFSFPRFTTERADLYLQDEMQFFDGRLSMPVGLRLAHYAIDPTGDKDYPGLPGYEPKKHDKTELIKRFAATWKFDDSWSAYAAYGEGFKMPTSQQLFQSSNDIFTGSAIIPNPALKPEYVKNYETGIRGEFDRGWFSLSTFYADYRDFIRSFQPVTVINPSGIAVTAYTFDNVSEVYLWGIEFGGEYEMFRDTTLSANVSWSDGKQRLEKGMNKTHFNGAVPLTATLGVKHMLPEQNLQLELFGTFAAGRTKNSNPNAFLPSGYAIFDGYAKWTPRTNLELTAGVENIFDRRYFPNTVTGYDKTASSAVANVNPLELQTGAGRVFKVGATVRF